MAVIEKDGCTIVLQKDAPDNFVCFDQRLSCVEEGSAGDYYKQLQQLSSQTRLMSNGKYDISLNKASDGIIVIANNLAIKTDDRPVESIKAIADKIIEIIMSARAHYPDTHAT